MKNKPNNWFKDRIGKKIFRTKGTCKCKICSDIYENGLIIDDEQHASYLEMVEGEGEGETIYFDTKKEVEDYENDQS